MHNFECTCRPARSRTCVNNLWALLVLAFPWAMSAEPWNAMWPGSRTAVLAAQYLFVVTLAFNGLVLFVLVGVLYERELRLALWPPWPRPSTWCKRSKSGAADDRRPLVRTASSNSDDSDPSSARSPKRFWRVSEGQGRRGILSHEHTPALKSLIYEHRQKVLESGECPAGCPPSARPFASSSVGQPEPPRLALLAPVAEESSLPPPPPETLPLSSSTPLTTLAPAPIPSSNGATGGSRVESEIEQSARRPASGKLVQPDSTAPTAKPEQSPPLTSPPQPPGKQAPPEPPLIPAPAMEPTPLPLPKPEALQVEKPTSSEEKEKRNPPVSRDVPPPAPAAGEKQPETGADGSGEDEDENGDDGEDAKGKQLDEAAAGGKPEAKKGNKKLSKSKLRRAPKKPKKTAANKT